jgi:hypothetical protein
VLPPSGLSLDELERELMCQALERADGNKTGAARLLGLSRDTLRYRLEKYGIESWRGPHGRPNLAPPAGPPNLPATGGSTLPSPASSAVLGSRSRSPAPAGGSVRDSGRAAACWSVGAPP